MPINDNTPRPQEFAAVDLGSNSFHMVIAREVDGAMQIIGRLKQRVHLADGLDARNMLSEEAMERGLNCLSLFAERLQGFSPSSVCIVGTHTLRQALNAPEFLKRAEKVIPYPIEIISGNEEASPIFMSRTSEAAPQCPFGRPPSTLFSTQRNTPCLKRQKSK